MKYTFQHFMDVATSSTSMQILTVRAGGQYVLDRCKHLFNTYKYFKLGGIKIRLVPASTLPVDPAGLSLSSSDPYIVNPIDQMNPGLVRITNGENVFKDLASLNDNQVKGMYTATMLDPRWSKFQLQSGFSRYAVPLFWDIGMNGQSNWPQSVARVPTTEAIDTEGQTGRVTGEIQTELFNTAALEAALHPEVSINDEAYTIQLGHRKRMGWLPTDSYSHYAYFGQEGEQTVVKDMIAPLLSRIPTTDVVSIVLPKAEKTIFFYRLFITESVFFKGIKNVGLNILEKDDVQMEYRSLDNFTFTAPPIPIDPSQPVLNQIDYPYKDRSGQI